MKRDDMSYVELIQRYRSDAHFGFRFGVVTLSGLVVIWAVMLLMSGVPDTLGVVAATIGTTMLVLNTSRCYFDRKKWDAWLAKNGDNPWFNRITVW